MTTRCCAYYLLGHGPYPGPGESASRCLAEVRDPRSRWCPWHGTRRDWAMTDVETMGLELTDVALADVEVLAIVDDQVLMAAVVAGTVVTGTNSQFVVVKPHYDPEGLA
jgi:hypothetical protein